jgi:hypothetical protein
MREQNAVNPEQHKVQASAGIKNISAKNGSQRKSGWTSWPISIFIRVHVFENCSSGYRYWCER